VRKHPSINGLGGREYIIGKDTYCEETPQYQRHYGYVKSTEYSIYGIGCQEYESEMFNGIKKLDEVLQEPSIGASLMMEY
jgi:hypothetical protein